MSARSAERAQFLADIITGAVEGGTGYWAIVLRYRWMDLPPEKVHAVLMIEDDEDEIIAVLDLRLGRRPTVDDALSAGHAFLLDIDAVSNGLAAIRENDRICNEGLRALIVSADRANDAGSIDANAADVIAQAAMFGEVIYG